MLGKPALSTGVAAGVGLIAIGPNVLAFGRVLRTARGTWTVGLDHFVLGDVTALRRFADSFPELESDDCYVCVEADGVGRMLVDAPTTDLTSGIIVELHVAAPLPLAEARKLFDATLRGPDLAFDLSGDEPDLDPMGTEVSGPDTIAQTLMMHLSTCKGGYAVGGEHGSRVAEFNERLGPEHITSIIAVETIRLATVLHKGAVLKRWFTPFDFVERVRAVRLLPTASAEFLKVAILLDVHGLEAATEFVVPISTSTRHLGIPPLLMLPDP